MPGAPVEVFVIGNLIWVATTCVNVADVMPASRAWANASSRFGPIVPLVPASASVWQPPQAWMKQLLARSLAARARVATGAAAREREREGGRARSGDEYDGPHGRRV